MTPDERVIRQLHREWIDAVNAGELDRLLAWMTDDVVLASPGGAPIGRDGFRAVFSTAHKDFHIRCVSELDEVTCAGDIAYTLCSDALSVTPRAGGETARLAGHRITIYRKQADGRWLLARDAHTLTPVK
jgi:uncharacterized protein (TIGR02246 family)